LIVDIASGPGAFLEVYLEEFPQAQGVWTDGSEVMQEQAMQRLARFGDRVQYRIVDMREIASAGLPNGADAVITSRASHHLSAADLTTFYAELAGLLAPGGWVVNLDHTAPNGAWPELFKAVRPRFAASSSPRAGHKHSQPLPSVSDQLASPSAAELVDCEVIWKSFQTVLLMGRKV
jgi:cyclopropane fatty-acyl-phospholipid synthase-like methyltransferase